MDWLRVQSVNDCFRISQLHLLGVYPQHQCLHCASNCMCGHCAEVKAAELGSFCYCCLFTLPQPKKVKLSFSQAKKKKRWKVNPCLSCGTANFAVNRNYTPPPHTRAQFGLSPTEELRLSSHTESLESQLKVPIEFVEDSPEDTLAVLLLQLKENWLFHSYGVILPSPQMRMPKGDLWLLLPNWSNSIFFTFSSCSSWLTDSGMMLWPRLPDMCTCTQTHTKTGTW